MFSPRRSLPRPDRDAASINDAFQRVLRSDVRYRFVIDAASLAVTDER